MKHLVVAALLIAFAQTAGAIEVYQAQEIQPYQGQKVSPRRAQAIKPYQAQDIKPYQAQDIKPYRAQEIKSYGGQDIQPYAAQDLQPHQTQEVQVNSAKDIAPQSASGGSTVSNVAPAPVAGNMPSPQPRSSKKQKGVSGAKALLGLWQTNIPGAVYTTPSGLAGYDTLHVSSGVAAGLLKINPNGTYSWNSYGGKKGKWVESGDAEYPIEIIDTVENRRWRVGYSSSKRALLIWSGSFWYEGQRATVKK